MTIRRARSQDATALGDMFVDAIRSAQPRHYYTEKQFSVWMAVARDREAFGARMLQEQVYVAEDASGPAGFSALGADGHVGALYVRGARQGQGVGGALLDAVFTAAREAGLKRLHAEASAYSRPLFEKKGFVVTGTETITRSGVDVERFLVERDRCRTG